MEKKGEGRREKNGEGEEEERRKRKKKGKWLDGLRTSIAPTSPPQWTMNQS